MPDHSRIKITNSILLMSVSAGAAPALDVDKRSK